MRGVLLTLLLCSVSAWAAEPTTFLGFRLLVLENQTVKWQSPVMGERATVTYAFATEATTTPGARNCAQMIPPRAAYEPSHITDGQFRREAAAAFRMWESAINIDFQETHDTNAAGILIGAQGQPQGRAFTNVALKQAPDGKVIGRSLICLNPRQPWKIGFDGNLNVYDLRYTIAHEIGHAIGLDHPSASGELMSYRYDERSAGLQGGDIKGAALLYGQKPGAPIVAGLPAGSSQAATADLKSGWPFGIGEAHEKPSQPR